MIMFMFMSFIDKSIITNCYFDIFKNFNNFILFICTKNQTKEVKNYIAINIDKYFVMIILLIPDLLNYSLN